MDSPVTGLSERLPGRSLSSSCAQRGRVPPADRFLCVCEFDKNLAGPGWGKTLFSIRAKCPCLRLPLQNFVSTRDNPILWHGSVLRSLNESACSGSSVRRLS